MEIVEAGIAGTLESSDIMITIESNAGKGIEIDLNSPVEKQYGTQIRKTIMDTLQELGLNDVKVTAVDKGALDCTIRARVKAAAYRACKSKAYKWG